MSLVFFALVHIVATGWLLNWIIVSDSPMGCLYCRKNISPLRKLQDPHFCCDEHRKKSTAKSARALREAEDLYGFGSNITPSKPEDKPERRAGFGGTIFVGAAIVVVLLGLSRVPMNSPPSKVVSP